MAARAIWKGVVRFSEVFVPVKLYSAALDHTIHFNLLHDQDLTQVRQKMVDPRSGEEVELADRRTGFQVEPGRFVLISPEELAELEPAATRDIQIERFVPEGSLDPRWYERPYHLGPDKSEDSYFALAHALERRKAIGIARWVMRKRDYAGALRVRDGRLMLISLRNAGELVSVEGLELPEGRAAEPRELKMAEQLVAALEDAFDPTDYQDEYRERVLELIETKLEGGELEFPEELEDPSRSRKSLVDLLEASIASVGGGKARR